MLKILFIPLSLIFAFNVLAADRISSANARRNYPGAVDEEPVKVQDQLKDVEVKTNRRSMELNARDNLFKTKEKAEAETPQ